MYPHDDTAAFETWPDRPEPGATWADLLAWQASRCAMCGTDRQRMVEDHDHRTGTSRGLLCWSCNVSEGVVVHAAWDRWRAGVNPAVMLGIKRTYPGRTYAEDEWTAEDQEKARRAINGIPAA